MKILHCCLANFYIDNYSYQENILSKKHKEMGYDVNIVASTETYVDKIKLGYVNPCSYITETGIPITRLPYSRLLPRFIMKKLRLYRGLPKLLREYQPDIIFIHGCQFMDIRHIVTYARANLNVKIYVDCHADFINSAKNWISKNVLHKIIYRYCAKIIEPYVIKFYGVLPARVDFLKIMYNIPREKLDLLLMGADDEKIDFNNKNKIRHRIREELEISENDFVIITGGKINEQKNIHLLMKAVNEVNNIKIKLIVFGSVDENIKNIIENLAKSDVIRFIGWVKSDKVYDYFLAADLAVFPGTHSVLWEQAIGTGLPCVFKKWKGMNHVDIGGNCLLLDECNSEEIKKCILNIYNNGKLYYSMKKVSEEKGISKFSYTNIAKVSIGE